MYVSTAAGWVFPYLLQFAFNFSDHFLFITDIGDREQLKALMSELKILIHIGSHVNILNLLGAVTVEVSRGSTYKTFYVACRCATVYFVAVSVSVRACLWLAC